MDFSNTEWRYFYYLKKIKNNNNIVSVIKTSGTISEKKNIFHTLENHYYNAYIVNKRLKFTKKKIWLLSLPINHISGFSLFFRSLLSNGKILFLRNKKELLKVLNFFFITHISLIENQFFFLLFNNKINLLKKKSCVLMGGSKISSIIINYCIKTKINLFLTYGATETCSQISLLDVLKNISKHNSYGKILDFYDYFLDSKNLLNIKGGSLFSIILKKNNILINNCNNFFFFKMNDLIKIDTEGYIYFYSRNDNLIINSAKKFFPEEIEEIIKSYYSINNAIVVLNIINKPVAFLDYDEEKFIFSNFISFLNFKILKFKIPFFFYKWPLEYKETSIKINRSFFTLLLKDSKKIKTIN